MGGQPANRPDGGKYVIRLYLNDQQNLDIQCRTELEMLTTVDEGAKSFFRIGNVLYPVHRVKKIELLRFADSGDAEPVPYR